MNYKSYDFSQTNRKEWARNPKMVVKKKLGNKGMSMGEKFMK